MAIANRGGGAVILGHRSYSGVGGGVFVSDFLCTPVRGGRSINEVRCGLNKGLLCGYGVITNRGVGSSGGDISVFSTVKGLFS